MKLHPIQNNLLKFIISKQGDLTNFSLRTLGESIGIGKKPQIITHHLDQLEKKGYLRKKTEKKFDFVILKKPIDQVVYINLYESAQCGPEGLLGDDNVIDRIPLPTKEFGITDPNKFLLIRARGNSMQPMINNRDLVLIKIQTQVPNGSVALVVHDEVPKIKKILSNKAKGSTYFSLISLNHKFTNEDVYNSSNLRVVGLVSGIIRTTDLSTT